MTLAEQLEEAEALVYFSSMIQETLKKLRKESTIFSKCYFFCFRMLIMKLRCWILNNSDLLGLSQLSEASGWYLSYSLS